jgi:hypothetical protein
VKITRKHWLTTGFVLVAGLFLMADSCSNSPAESQTQAQVNDQQTIYNRNQPIHTYQYSAERAALQQLYDYRVKGNLNTWSVWISNNGVPLGMCESKGFPLPYGVELTNPTQAISPFSSSAVATVGQADPNGLFPPANTLGTWIFCLEKDGTMHPQYMEPLVLTFTYPVDISSGKIVRTGDPTTASVITTK